MIDIQCRNCGNVFRGYPSDLVNGRGKHCSRVCAQATRTREASTPEHLHSRYWEHVAKDGPVLVTSIGPCWRWTGQKWKGYGQFMSAGKHVVKAHRLSWEIHNGPIPTGMHVLHKCDNPECSNPEHLFLGTHQDNMADMARKGRWTPRRMVRGDEHHMRSRPIKTLGENNGFAKFTESTVRDVRALFAAGGISKAELARRFNVTRTQIWMVVTGRTWRHVL